MVKAKIAALATAITMAAAPVLAAPGAYLEITLKIDDANRAAAAAVYTEFKQPFLDTIPGAEEKILLIRPEDVQVLHGFKTADQAKAYLSSDLFTNDVVKALTPYLTAAPEVRIYQVP